MKRIGRHQSWQTPILNQRLALRRQLSKATVHRTQSQRPRTMMMAFRLNTSAMGVVLAEAARAAIAHTEVVGAMTAVGARNMTWAATSGRKFFAHIMVFQD